MSFCCAGNLVDKIESKHKSDVKLFHVTEGEKQRLKLVTMKSFFFFQGVK